MDEEPHHDLEQLKSRTMISLEKLGQQVFSSEDPGGYTMRNWISNFNLLLDDFESKAAGALPKEYFERRLELTATLVKPIDTSEVDRELELLRSEVETTSNNIAREELLEKQKSEAEISELAGRIDSLRTRLHECQRQLEAERAALEQRRSSRRSKKSDSEAPKSLFKKLFSSKVSDPNSAESIARRINEIQTRSLKLEEEMHALQEERNLKLRSGSSTSKGAKQLEEEERLESMRARITELSDRRAELLQQAEQRKSVTHAMSEVISHLNAPERNAQETGTKTETEGFAADEESS